jgi:hypothetical protein
MFIGEADEAIGAAAGDAAAAGAGAGVSSIGSFIIARKAS